MASSSGSNPDVSVRALGVQIALSPLCWARRHLVKPLACRASSGGFDPLRARCGHGVVAHVGPITRRTRFDLSARYWRGTGKVLEQRAKLSGGNAPAGSIPALAVLESVRGVRSTVGSRVGRKVAGFDALALRSALEVFVVACQLAMLEERVRLSSSAPLRASPSGWAPGFHPGLREFNSPCALYRGVGHRMCRCIRDADQAGSTPVSSTAGWVAQMVEAAASGAVC